MHVKSLDAHRAGALLGAQAQLVGMTTRLSNHIRGVLRTFGLLPGAMRGSPFDRHVEELLVDCDDLAPVVRPPLAFPPAAQAKPLASFAHAGGLVTAARSDRHVRQGSAHVGQGGTDLSLADKRARNRRIMRLVRGWVDPTRRGLIPCCSERVWEAVMARRRIGQERLLVDSAGPRGGTSLDEVAALVEWTEIDGLLVDISSSVQG